MKAIGIDGKCFVGLCATVCHIGRHTDRSGPVSASVTPVLLSSWSVATGAEPESQRIGD